MQSVRDYQIMIVGGGVVGLAIAARLSEKFNRILLIEKHESFGHETSSRNSEVIHAGIYYPENSLKAKFCVPGNARLYGFCEKFDIPHRKIGKYIVAVTEDEAENLNEIRKKAHANGAVEVDFADKRQFLKEEPYVRGYSALFSPQTGIIDSHALMAALEQKAIENGCDIVYNHELISINLDNSGYSAEIKASDNSVFQLNIEKIINSAGLNSDLVAEMAGIDIDAENLRLNFCRGNYFRIIPSKKHFANHLIYPVPRKNLQSLGIHVTKELDGSLKLGPDTEWLVDRLQDYRVSTDLHGKFFEAASSYLIGLAEEDIYPDQSGIRPKLQTEGGEFRDFYIREESERGLTGFVNLIGIESPGLTCCLEIADYVCNLV